MKENTSIIRITESSHISLVNKLIKEGTASNEIMKTLKGLGFTTTTGAITAYKRHLKTKKTKTNSGEIIEVTNNKSIDELLLIGFKNASIAISSDNIAVSCEGAKTAKAIIEVMKLKRGLIK